jgi:hypothetical protein
MDGAGQRRSPGNQPPVERRTAAGFRLGQQLGSNCRVTGRQVIEAVPQTPQVKWRSANQEDAFASPSAVDHGTRCCGQPIGDGKLGRRFDQVDQMVRHPGPLDSGRLGRPDIEAAIDRDRIDTEDFGVEPLCHPQGHGGLPGCGGSGQNQAIGVQIRGVDGHRRAVGSGTIREFAKVGLRAGGQPGLLHMNDLEAGG